MRLLVCGGRDYEDRAHIWNELNKFHAAYNITLLIEGAAPGVDTIAYWWAMNNQVETKRYPADWEKLSRAAGHIRNQQMLDEGKPDHVLAFPGGSGTQDMISRAMKARVLVTVIAKLKE